MPDGTDIEQVVRQLVDAFNERDRERFDACYGPRIVVHASDGSTRTMDHDEHWDEVLGSFRLFPDLSAQIDDMLSVGDLLFLRGSYTGTHEGSSESGIEPTGRTATWAWWCEYRFEDGRIVEAWNLYDGVGQLQQLGLFRPPGPNEDAGSGAAAD